MCGHDSHCAMLLGAMIVLASLRNQISGTILCCFESGEENGTGYVEMLEALEKYPVDTCFAIHVVNALESGKISVESGPRMAGGIGLEMTLHGRGGHGSRPDLAINPIVPAAEIVSQLPGILKNRLHPEAAITCGFGLFQAGTARNIIPEAAKLDGTLRVFDMDVAQKAFEITRKTVDTLAALHNCTVSYGPKFRIYAAPVVNNPEKSRLMEELLEEAWPEETVSTSTPKWYACEYFGFYIQRYPGTLAMLGIKNDDLGSGAEHHNARFDLDENVLDRGVLCHLLYVAAHCM